MDYVFVLLAQDELLGFVLNQILSVGRSYTLAPRVTPLLSSLLFVLVACCLEMDELQ